MAAGLKKAWGLGDAKKGPSDKQAKEFRAAFQAALAPITGALGWTATNAEQAKHDPQSSARDQAYEKYQSVMSLIDATNPKKAAGAISSFLSDLGGLGNRVSDFKRGVEAAKKAWEAVADVLTDVIDKIAKLEDWGMDGVSKLLELVKKVQDAVADRMWEVAKETIEQLQKQLEPLWEEYEKQKAAKEKYDKDRPTLDKQFEAVKKLLAQVPEGISNLLGDVTSGLDDAGQKADEKDYVVGFGGLGKIGPMLKRLTELAEENEKARKEYESRLKGMAKGLAALDNPVDGEEMKATQSRIQGRRKTMEAAAAGNDYTAALSEMKALEPEVAAYVDYLAKIQAKKAKFEARKKAIAPDLEVAKKPVKNAALEAQQTAITKRVADMDKFAAAGNYDAALEEIDAAESITLQYSETEKIYREKLEQCSTRFNALSSQLTDAGKAVHKALKPMQKEILGKEKATRKAIADEDPDAATNALDWLEPALKSFKEAVTAMENAKEEYEKREPAETKRTEAAAGYAREFKNARFNELKKSIPGNPHPRSAGAQNFEQALAELFELKADLDAFDTLRTRLEKLEEKYRKGYDAIKADLDEAGAAKILNGGLVPHQKRIVDRRAKMEASASEGDHESALADLDYLGPALKSFKVAFEDIEKERAEYESRMKGLEGKLTEAAESVPGTEIVDQQAKVTTAKGEAEALAQVDDFDKALAKLDALEVELTKCLALIKAQKARIKEYDGKLPATTQRVNTLAQTTDDPMAKKAQANILALNETMKSQATSGDYAAALSTMQLLNAECTGYETLIARLAKQGSSGGGSSGKQGPQGGGTKTKSPKGGGPKPPESGPGDTQPQTSQTSSSPSTSNPFDQPQPKNPFG